MNNKDKLWTDFGHCSGVPIVDFEQVNAGWKNRNSVIKSVGNYQTKPNVLWGKLDVPYIV